MNVKKNFWKTEKLKNVVKIKNVYKR